MAVNLVAQEPPPVDLDARIASLRSLVDARRFDEAKSQAESLKSLLAAESERGKKEVKEASEKDDWKKVATIAEQMKAHARRQDILKFLADEIADTSLSEAKRDRFVDIAVSSLEKVEEDPITAFDDLKAAGFKLRRTSDEATGDQDKPALFGLSRDFEKGTKTEFTADFYLSWNSTRVQGEGRRQVQERGKEVGYELSVEGHLNSTDDKAGDAWKLRAERKAIFSFDDKHQDDTVGLSFDLGGKLEANRDFERQRLSAELQMTPTWSSVGLGRFQPATEVLIAGKKPEAEAPIQFRWRPYVTVDAGNIISGNERVTDSAVWLSGRLKFELALNFLKGALGVDSVTMFADGTSLYATDNQSWHTYLETGLDIMFNKNVGFTALYKTGEMSPDFDQTNLFTSGITVKF